MHISTAGDTRKSHKSRKTTPLEPVQPESSVASGVSPSTDNHPTQPSPGPNDIGDVLSLVPKSAGKDTTSPADERVPTEGEPKTQWWYRPSDSKVRKKAEKIFVLRAAGHKPAVIAKKLNTTEGTVRQIVFLARKNRWVDEEDEPVDLEAELALNIERKVVRNIDASLDGRMTNWQTHEMTIAAAKGRGIFKNHETAKGETVSGIQVVAIRVLMPPIGAGDQQIIEENVGGVPAYVEGEMDHVDAGPAAAALPGPQDSVDTES